MTTTTEKRPTKKALAEAEKAEYAAKLREMLPPGTTVYTILRRVSASGMMRHISLVVMTPEGPHDITGWAGLAMGQKWDRDTGALKVGGCGMDMGFHLVYNLSYTLYPQGFECAGEACRSNDHSIGDRDRSPHHHSNGGYALPQRWL